MKISRTRAGPQPQPRTPGLTRTMLRRHARRVFRDVVAIRPLTEQEWRLVEADLLRRIEHAGW